MAAKGRRRGRCCVSELRKASRFEAAFGPFVSLPRIAGSQIGTRYPAFSYPLKAGLLFRAPAQPSARDGPTDAANAALSAKKT